MQLISPMPLGQQPLVAAFPTPLRPYGLAGARSRPVSAAVEYVAPVYDPVSQTAALPDGTPLTAMATSKKTVQDGDIKNPPPPDEGSDPGSVE
ncbi:putative ATP-grasp-modified RiPP [Streptomyces sp. MNP-20]|uniref:putative ATP-grasp-modified RiPP n=1 Tax=Streptomyces sp. MNP-20 TaxID=2721165 RepID=UPI001554DED9|nr:putative ATP-grasp-modified RiPP [Streptomyces sp. MNP-20]